MGTGSTIRLEAIAGVTDGTVCSGTYAVVRDAVGKFGGDIGHRDGMTGERMGAVAQVLDLTVSDKGVTDGGAGSPEVLD